jgi:Trp operon repressor
MVRVNKKNLEEKLKSEGWERLFGIVKRSSSGKALRENLERVLTPSEMTQLEKRLLILVLLSRGFTYRQIGEAIDVTRVTISFVKHNLRRTPRVQRHYDSLHKPRNENDASLFMSPREHARRLRRKVGL